MIRVSENEDWLNIRSNSHELLWRKIGVWNIENMLPHICRMTLENVLLRLNGEVR